MKKPIFVLFSILFLTFVSTSSAAAKKNVLFIVVDDLRPVLGCYGDDIAQTPNIDRIAEQGMLFERAYCQQAVCNASRHSFLTGLRPDSIRVWDLKQHFRDTRPEALTLPQLFKQSGYHTQSIGKIFHGSGRASKDDPSWSDKPLFDVALLPEQRYALPQNLRGNGLKRSATEKADISDDYYIDGQVCQSALKALDSKANSSTPFFLAVGFRKPHLPFNAPEKYWDLYQRDKFPSPLAMEYPANAPELATRSWRELEGYSDISSDGDVSKEKLMELRHGYYSCVSYVDSLIGKLVQKLEDTNQAENTLIVILGDHGFHLGEQGLWTKANNYELSARVPLIIFDPGQPNKNLKTEALVELVDVYPTIASLCNLSIPADLDGVDMAPLFMDPNREWKKAAFTQWPRSETKNRHSGQGDIMGRSVRTDRYRFVQWQSNVHGDVLAEELYDHHLDPLESVNHINYEEYSSDIIELRELVSKGAIHVKNDLILTLSQSQKYNVLFLAVDDLKDWVGCLYGYEGRVYTPNIDKLASRGVLFNKAYTASPKCAPSRAAIMTGLMPSTTGLYDNGHWWYANMPDVVTIPKHFMNHEYHVYGAGKIFHHTAGNHPPNQWHDFKKLTFQDDPWFRGSKLNYPWSQHVAFPKAYPFSGVSGLGHENDWGSLDITEPEYDDAQSADYAIGKLAQEFDKPFFLACGLFRPHLPWYAPKKYFDLYSIDEIQLPKTDPNDRKDLPSAGKQFAKARESDFHKIRDQKRWREAVHAYLASISFMDAQIGRVLTALQQSKYADTTYVILWSDHGWHLGEKGHWHKSTLWEESTRVPLIISGPNIRPGIVESPVSLVDVYPTLIDLCHLNNISQLDGESLVPLLENNSAERTRPAIMEFKKGNVAIRSNRYRFIQYADGGRELYDHAYDPYEWNNIINKDHAPAIVSRLSRWLPKDWAPSKPTKNAFQFDPTSFTWTKKSTGERVDGKN